MKLFKTMVVNFHTAPGSGGVEGVISTGFDQTQYFAIDDLSALYPASIELWEFSQEFAPVSIF